MKKLILVALAGVAGFVGLKQLAKRMNDSTTNTETATRRENI